MNAMNSFKLFLVAFLVMQLTSCNKDTKDDNGKKNPASTVWDVETQCGGAVNTDAFSGPVNLLVYVKNSGDSKCTVTAKSSGRNVGAGLNSGRIYHPGSNKIYTRVNVANGKKLQIFCSGEKGKPCKFNYGVQIL